MVPLAIWPVPKSITCLTKINPATNENKFWAVGFERVPMSSSLVLRRWWGRIDTVGQTDTVGPFSEEQCLDRARELVAAKLREGYRRQDGIDFEAPFLQRRPPRPKRILDDLATALKGNEGGTGVTSVTSGTGRSAKQRERALVVLSSERVIDFED